MISELIYLIKTHFRQSENGLMQIVLLNVLSFLLLLLVKIVLVVSGYESVYIALCQNLSLPALWSTYLHQPWALLTYFWVHVSFFPTLWGLLLLYTLGQVVVKRLGSRHFVALYCLGGIAGGLLFLLLYNMAPYFQGTTISLLGFSGSLYAVIVAAVTLTPQLSFSFFLLGTLKFRYIAGFLILLSLVHLVGPEPAVSMTHLGGALLGYVYAKWCQQGYIGWHRYWARFIKGRLKVTHRSTVAWPSQDTSASTDQASLDHILDKVAASGYESLTPAEKQQLFNAGQ